MQAQLRTLIVLTTLVFLVSVAVQAQDISMNPATLAFRSERQLNTAYQLEQGWQITYSEPDYGTGAGALGWLHFSGEERADWLTYSVAKEVNPQIAAGITLRYQASESEKHLTGDLGLVSHLNSVVVLELVAEDALSYAFKGEPLNLNVRPAISVRFAEIGVAALELHDAFNSSNQREWRLETEVSPTDSIDISAALDYGLVTKGSTWRVGAAIDFLPWQVDYSLSRGNKTEQSFRHQLGVGFSF